MVALQIYAKGNGERLFVYGIVVVAMQTDNNSVKVLVKRVSRELFYPVEESLDAACVVRACGVRYFRPS